MFAFTAAAIALVTFVLSLVAMRSEPYLTWWYDFGAATVITMLVGWYLRGVQNLIHDRSPENCKVDEVKVYNLWAPKKAVHNVAHVLNENEEIILLTRWSKTYLWLRISAPLLLALGCLVGMVLLGEIKPQPVKFYWSTINLTIPWWGWAVAALLCLFIAWCLALEWMYSYRIITDRRIILLTVPPVWLPLLDSPPKNFYHDKVTSVEAKDIKGRMFKFGGIQADTPGQNDQVINNLKWVKNNREFASIYDTTVQAVRSKRHNPAVV